MPPDSYAPASILYGIISFIEQTYMCVIFYTFELFFVTIYSN